MEKIHDDDEPKSPAEENPTFSDQIPATFTDILPSSEIKNSIHSGFTDMLDIQDYSSTPCLFDMFQTTPPEMAAATSGNSTSISSSSTEVTNDTKTTPEEEEDDPQKTINKHELKPKKKNTKRIRQPRFAFMTKSDVDHLDDGYRWRKYGQKAVKNSPFPRSYYRCTTTSCGVKKRVERSSQDPSIVVTTYEGTHTHQCPVTPPRGNNIGPVVPHDQIATGSSGGVLGAISPNLFISQPYNHYQFYNHALPILSTPPLPFDLSTNYNNPTTTTSNYNPLLSDFIHQERFYYPPSSSTSPSSSSSASMSSSSVRDSGLLQDMIMPSKAREGSKDDHDQL